jgi:DNA-binding GntR family transcriptional regulator
MARTESSPPDAVTRRSMADEVFHALTERILRGELKPGDRLKELEIARQFRTSQAPVREALCRLEASRLVQSECYRGARVRAFQPEELREVYEVRAVLDAHAGTVVARQLKGSTEHLQQLAERTRKAAARKDFAAYAAADMPFHRAIVEAAGNSVLLRLWDSLDFEARSLEFLCRNRFDLSEFAEDHFRIVDALNRGDGRTASRLLRNHSLAVAKVVQDTR